MNIIDKFFRALRPPSDEQARNTANNWHELFKIIETVKVGCREMTYPILHEHGHKMPINFSEKELELVLFAHFLKWWCNVTCQDQRTLYIGALSYTDGKLMSMENHAIVAEAALNNIKKLNNEKWFTDIVLIRAINLAEEDLPESIKILSFNILSVLSETIETLYLSHTEQIQALYLHYLFDCKFHGSYFFDIGQELAAS